MNSEKVKDIKKALEEEALVGNAHKLKFIRIDFNLIKDILTLINELESELKEEQISSFNCNTLLQLTEKENQHLKDRIDELESKNKILEFGQRITNDVLIKENQIIAVENFVERLKEKMPVHFPLTIKAIDETLKEFINKENQELKEN